MGLNHCNLLHSEIGSCEIDLNYIYLVVSMCLCYRYVLAGRGQQTLELEFLPVEEIQEVLEKNLRECPDGLHEELAEDLLR